MSGPSVAAWPWPTRSTRCWSSGRPGRARRRRSPFRTCWPLRDPVIATSTKPDVLAPTLGIRSGLGRCWLLDPTGTVSVPPGVTRIRWSPVPPRPRGTSRWCWPGPWSARPGRPADEASPPTGPNEPRRCWLRCCTPPIFPAPAWSRCSSGCCARTSTGPAAVLAIHGVETASDVLAGHRRDRPARAVGNLVQHRRRTRRLPFRRRARRRRRRSTSTRGRSPAPATPSTSAPRLATRTWSPRSSSPSSSRPAPDASRPGPAAEPGLPLTLVLDELANIAPLPDLPALVSEGGGQGVLTLACLQDLSQARQRWGPAADGFLSLFGTKVVLPGIADLATLELVSRLGGEVEVPSRSVSRGPWWSRAGRAPTVTWSSRRQRRLPVESVCQQPAGTALALCGARAPERVRLSPWWATAPFRSVARPGPQPPHPTIGR